MLIAFRTDANAQIGTGHLMRCLALADALAARGAKCLFLSRGTGLGVLAALITKSGHSLMMMPDAFVSAQAGNDNHVPELVHAHWLPDGYQADASASLAALADHSRPEWIVIDHYALDARWHRELRSVAHKIMVIDDLADRDHDCDLLLDQNLYLDMDTRYLRKVPSQCWLLLGPQYALLREEFRRARMSVRTRIGPVRRILVAMGGVDASNITCYAIKALEELDLQGVNVDVVIGRQHPYREEIQTTCKRLGFSCYIQTYRMADLMTTADLAVGAGGSMIWERCCLGLPAIVVPAAINQWQSTRNLDHLGIIEMVDVPREHLREAIATAVDQLCAAPARLHEMSAAALLQVDGQGTLRVADTMIKRDSGALKC